MPRKPKSGRRVNATGRSEGGESHVRLYGWELKSPAYRALSIGGRALLIELKALYNGRNNGELFLSVRDAAGRLGVSKNYAWDRFWELRRLGFIRPHRVGAFNLKSEARRGEATSWVLTEFALGPALPTKDFMHWRPSRLPVAEIHSTVPIERQTVSASETLPGNVGQSVPPKGTLSVEADERRSRLKGHR